MQPISVGLVIGNKPLWDEARAVLESLNARVLLERAAIEDWTGFVDQVERLRPEILLLDVSNLSEPVESVIERVLGTAASPAVIAVHTAADPIRILAAMRAGAAEFLFPPIELGLREAVGRVLASREQRPTALRPGGKVFGLFSAKGGCGATTIACHLALECRRLTSNQTLLLDLDLEAGMVGFLMKAKSPYSVLDAIGNVHRLDPNLWKGITSNGRPGIEIVKAPESGIAGDRPKPEAIRHILRFARAQYKTSIVDLGRGLNPTLMIALEEADESFLVTTLDVPALHRAKQIVQTLVSSGLPKDRLRLLINRMPRKPEITPEEIGKNLGLPVYQEIPNDYLAFYEAYAEGNLLSPDQRVMRQIGLLASKMLDVKESGKKKSKFGLW